MICKKCKKSFPTFVNIDGKMRNFQHRKYCLECSPFGLHNTKPLDEESINKNKGRTDLQGIIKNFGDECVCKYCSKIYIKNRKNNKQNNICSSCSVNQRRFKLKEELILLNGGKCKLCGYCKCNDALQFHHLDPSKKDFAISGNHTRAKHLVIEESKKCILVCSNCHVEIHDGLHPNII